MAIADKPAGRVATHEEVAPPALLLVGAAGQGRGLVRSGHDMAEAEPVAGGGLWLWRSQVCRGRSARSETSRPNARRASCEPRL